MTNLTYVVEDSLVFFVMNRQMDVYKLVFNSFDYTVGKAIFTKTHVSAAAVPEITAIDEFTIYPNPASGAATIQLAGNQKWNNLVVSDITGKAVFETKLFGESSLTIPVDKFEPGVYVVSLLSDNSKAVQKLIIHN